MKYLLSAVIFVAILAVGSPRESRAQSPMTTQETIDYVLPRVVKIYGAGGFQRLAAYGTGFLVSKDGHIATIWSHVLDAREVTVVLDDGRKYTAEMVGAEPALDIAVIKIDGTDLPHFDLEKAGTRQPGTRVLGFSNMFKVATGNEPVSVLHGVIAARTKLTARRGNYELPYDGEVYIVDAITNNSGAAGGVLLSYDGQLLGMIGKELRDRRSHLWINYAMPMTDLRDVINDIITGNYDASSKPDKFDPNEKPRNYAPIDFGIVMVPDVLYRTPAYVERVTEGSAAQKVGLKPDDLVVFVNDELIQSCKDLKDKLGVMEAGDLLKLTVRRGPTLVAVEIPVLRKETVE